MFEYIIGGGIGCIAAYFLREKWQDRRINQLHKYIETLENENVLLKQRENAAKGREAKAQQSAEEQAAIQELVAALGTGGDIKQVLGTLAVKYPTLAQKYMGKLM